VSDCAPQAWGQPNSGTLDCVARGLPAGASVYVRANEVGGSSIFVDWLPPVDRNGDVPFPYRRPTPGRVIFTVVAGGVTVTFEHVWS